MSQDALKQAAALAAFEHVRPHLSRGTVIGAGTGSTANHFIDALATVKHLFDGVVASSRATAERLQHHGIAIRELNEVDELPFYVDGADEATPHLKLIKGGGAALTGEKIIAAVATQFICIADESKLVDVPGRFPLPVEVIPAARSYVAKELVKAGGRPALRAGVTTDYANQILYVHGLEITDPPALERHINQITGVVTCGLFACRGADLLLLGTGAGIRELRD